MKKPILPPFIRRPETRKNPTLLRELDDLVSLVSELNESGSDSDLLKGELNKTYAKNFEIINENILSIKDSLASVIKAQEEEAKDKPRLVETIIAKIPLPKDGVDGKNAPIPIKGKDYFTPKEVESIIGEVQGALKTPTNGKDAVIDEDKIVEKILEKMVKEKRIKMDHVDGLNSAQQVLRNFIANGSRHGGGDTIAAGANITLTRNSNGTTTIAAAASGGSWGSITGTLSSQTDLQTALDAKVTGNGAITGATKTKITYDTKGLVTAGADATTADIADSSNKRYITDAQQTVLTNTSGVNTGDQTLAGLGGLTHPQTLARTLGA